MQLVDVPLMMSKFFGTVLKFTFLSLMSYGCLQEKKCEVKMRQGRGKLRLKYEGYRKRYQEIKKKQKHIR